MWPEVRRWLLIGTVVLLAVASVYGAGVATGWSLADRQAAARESVDGETDFVEVEVPVFGADSDAVMPDVRGLEPEQAFQVLADAQIPRDAVTVETRPTAGRPGVVVEQAPAFGTSDPEGPLVVVSAEAAMPEAVGRSGEDVVAELEELGAVVSVEYRYVPDEPAGTVLSTTPEAGAAVPAEVTVELAESSSSLFLSALEPVEGGCGEVEAMVNGDRYPQSLECPGSQDTDEVAWVIGRAAETVTGTIGVPDDGDPEVAATVEIVADGSVLDTVQVAYGEPADVELSVSGTLRLTMRITLEGGEDAPTRGDVVLGDVRLEGGASALDELVVEVP